MKSLCVLFSLFLTIGIVQLQAQETGEVEHVMTFGTQNALYIDLPGTSAAFAEKEWKDFVDQYGKAKKVKKGDELLVEAAQVLDIGGVNPVNLYARAEETGTGARHYLWIETDGQYISSSSNRSAYEGGIKLLQDFGHKIKIDNISIELDSQQKALDDLEKDLQKLKKDNDGYHKTIEDAKERIAKAETDIAKNVQDQQLRMQEIGSQQKVVEDVRKKLEAARVEKN